MYRFSDKWNLSWNDSGDKLTAISAACANTIITLSDEELSILECIERLGGATREVITEDLASELQPAATEKALNHLINEGVLKDTEYWFVNELPYTPMIYYQMLADSMKMDAYVSALRRVVKPGMTVLDAGTGLGVMGTIAAQLGAKKVWAVDNHPVIYQAQQLARENGVGDIVECLQGDLLDTSILDKIGKVDLILSEFVGEDIFDEGILPKTIKLRNTFFPQQDGLLLPYRLQAFWAPIECDLATNRLCNKLQTTESIGIKYGVNMKAVCDMLSTEGRRNDFGDRLYGPSFSEISVDDLRFLGESKVFFDCKFNELANATVLSQEEVKATHAGRLDGILIISYLTYPSGTT
ncbi:50S ribosomal protein L11 methyltransferase [Candidatus Electrothrix sp.]|uniref:50S ribosomal protein L11 methyltransferase n=1 Tax=Candidatus Electrothrix sp. TaxID=2170559 RepID=UPI0040570C4E